MPAGSASTWERWPWLNLARGVGVPAAAFVQLAAGDAVDGRSTAVQLVTQIGTAATWGVGLVALIVPSTASLTAVRMVAPLAVVIAAVALVAGAAPLLGTAALVIALAAALIVAGADTGRSFVQASAYGDELRLLLRPPAAVVPVTVASWVLWAATVLSGPLLLAARQWVPGVALTGAAVVLTRLLVPRFHVLSRRWLVTLSTGLVVHDQLVLGETVMIPRAEVRSVSLALDDTDAADLTGPAAGHAVEVRVDPMVTINLRHGRGDPTAIHAAAFFIAPSRPGAALAAAAEHHLGT